MSKNERTIDPKLVGPISTNIKLSNNPGETTVVETFEQRAPSRKFTMDIDNTFSVPGSKDIAGDKHRRFDNLPRLTERDMNEEMDKYLTNYSKPGMGNMIPKNKEDFRTTLKETLLHSRIAGPPEAQNKEARDMTNYQLEPTNKELNIENKHVGLAERPGFGEMNREIGTLRTTIRETNIFNNEGRNLFNPSLGGKLTKESYDSDRSQSKDLSEIEKNVNVGGMALTDRNEHFDKETRRTEERVNFDESKLRNIPQRDHNNKFTDSADISMHKIKSRDFVFN
jgi:hypothetical protein